MLRNQTVISVMLFAALSLTGCSSRQGDRLSESDYPYTGPPAEDNGGNGRHVSTGQDASGGRYATARGRRTGGVDYYGQMAYAYGRDPSYDYYLASDDDYGYDDEYGYDDRYGSGYPEEVAYFYDELDPYGDWYEDARYGWVWQPEYVTAGWRPYLYGHWVYTDWGWAWVSDDPWGADTYHYGRWNCDASNRWFWVPDDVWGPAWVSWRYGDGWAGWAPLPPEAGWDVSFGLRYTNSFVDASRWCFVPESRLTSTRLRTYVAPLTDTRRIYRETRDYTRYASVGGRAAERGLRPSLIERRTGRDIPEYRLVTRESGRRDMVRGRTLVSPMPVLSRGQGRGRTDRVTREMRVRQERFAREMRTNRGRIDRDLRTSRGRVDREQVIRGRGGPSRGQVQGRVRDVREERVRRDRAIQEQQRFERRQQQQRGYERQQQQRLERQRQERGQQQRFEPQQQERGYERQQQRFERQQQERGRSEERRMQRQRSEIENRGRVEQQARREEVRQRGQQAQVQRREEARQRAEQAQYQRQQQQQQREQQQQQQQQQRQARGRQQRQEPPQQDGEPPQQDSDQRGHGRGRGHNR